jgi:uncharacterized protein
VKPLPAPIWFVAALVPMVASQVLRLHQHDPGGWLFWDYAGRLAGLAVLAATAWPAAFRREKLRMPWVQMPLWVLGIVLADHYLGGWIRTTGNDLFPSTVLGHYPQPSGWLYWFDTVFGIGLVGYSEEVVFRRCARHVFKPYLGDGSLLVLVTSLPFGAYHWWTGVGNILEAVLMGVLFMLFLQRSGSLWPVVLSHYLNRHSRLCLTV